MTTKQTAGHTPGPCEAEIQNAREYLSECEAMQAEARARGDLSGKIADIQLGVVRAHAINRLRELERAKFRAEVARA